MSHDGDRIRNMEQEEPTDDGIKRRGRAPLERVPIGERDLNHSRLLRALTRHGEDVCRLIDAQNRARRADQLACEPRNVPEAGAQIQDAHAGGETGCLQQKAGRTLDDRRLMIEPREFLSVIAENVLHVASDPYP